jgi:glycosyltransferase involved in cell wall biosynthesis
VEPIQNAILRGHPIDWFLFILFVVLFVLHVAYMLLITLRSALHKNMPAGKLTPLSLLLIVKNEEENLRRNLKPLLEKHEGDYEVVAVDNFSQDESPEVLDSLKTNHLHLTVSSLKQNTPYSEKMAQNIALKAARHDWVTLIPPSADMTTTPWLKEVSSRLNSGSHTVVNYSNIIPQRSFHNLLFRVESFFQQVKSFGFIANRLPFVLSQENVAFQKQLYFNEGGFRGKISEPFANLELVINSFIRKGPVLLNLSTDTALHREEDVKLKDYLELVKKEVYVRKNLPLGIRILLVLYEWVTLLFIPVTALLIVRVPAVWPLITGMVICLILCNLLIIKKILSRLQEYKLFLPSFVIAILLPFVKLAFRLYYFSYGRKKEWKIGN